MIRKSLAFLAAASLAVTPALAAPSMSAPVAPSVERAGPADASSDLNGGASVFPMIVFAAIVVAGVLLATGVIFDNNHPDQPTSP